MGRLFFDLLQPQCVQGRSCAPHEPADACLERLKAEQGPKKPGMKFFDQPQGYDVIPPRVADVGGRRGGSGGSGGNVGDGAGNRTQGEDARRGSVAKDTVQIAAVGLQSSPTKATSSSGGGLSSFFRSIWNTFG